MYHSFPRYHATPPCSGQFTCTSGPPIASFPPQPFGARIQIALLTRPSRRRRWAISISQASILPNLSSRSQTLIYHCPLPPLSYQSTIQSCTIHTRPSTCLISLPFLTPSKFRNILPLCFSFSPVCFFSHSLIPSLILDFLVQVESKSLGFRGMT